MKPLRAWAVQTDAGQLITFTPDGQDVELFASQSQAQSVARALGCSVVRVEIRVVDEGMQ